MTLNSEKISHPVVDRVRELAPKLRERGPLHDELRRLPDETVADLRDSGVMRLAQPARYGGFEADPRVFYECVLAIAAADGFRRDGSPGSSASTRGRSPCATTASSRRSGAPTRHVGVVDLHARRHW